jgi:hypothetical protein
MFCNHNSVTDMTLNTSTEITPKLLRTNFEDAIEFKIINNKITINRKNFLRKRSCKY